MQLINKNYPKKLEQTKYVTKKWRKIVCVSGIDVYSWLQKKKFNHIQMTLSCTDMTLEKEKINFNDAWICNYRITQPTEHNWMFIPSIWVYSCLESISKLVIYIVTLNKNRFTVKDFQPQVFSHRISSLSSPKVNCFLMIFFPNKLLPAHPIKLNCTCASDSDHACRWWSLDLTLRASHRQLH